MESIWSYDYDHHLGKWVLRRTPVERRTHKYVFTERARLSIREVCFSPEEALDRWVAASKNAIKLKERRIEHLKEGIEHARKLRELSTV